MERQKLLRSAQNKIFDIFPTVNLLPFPPFLSQTDTVGRSGEPSFVFFSNFDPEKITKSKSKSLEQSLRVKRIAVSKPVELVWDAWVQAAAMQKKKATLSTEIGKVGDSPFAASFIGQTYWFFNTEHFKATLPPFYADKTLRNTSDDNI